MCSNIYVVNSLAHTRGNATPQMADWIPYGRESARDWYSAASRMAAVSHDKMVATLTVHLPDFKLEG